jgi:tetratricopeptide (TPR) repeat protein
MAKAPSSITVTPKSQPKELRTSREGKCRRRQKLNILLQVSVGIVVSLWLAVLIVQVETPGCISYYTPKEENSASVVADDVQRIIHEVGHLEFTTETENSHLNNPTSKGTYPVLDEAFLTVANMGAQFGLPTFTKKVLLEITKGSDGAAAAMALAADKDRSDNMSKAMIAYRDAIEQIIQIDGHTSPGTCQPPSGPAENASFDDSISIYRQVITQITSPEGPTQESETESLLKIVAIESLARTLFINKQCNEAESMFSDASEPFRKLGYPAYSFNCVLRQAQMLQEVGQHDKALPLLHSLLVYRLEHDKTTFDIMDVALSLEDSYVALSLGETHRSLRDKDWSELISRLNDLIRIAKSTINVYETSSPIIMEAVILIADALSAADEFEKANSLLLVALAKTTQWAIDDDTKYNKANCNYIYAKHLSQQRNYSKAALHLIVALETLMSIGQDWRKLAFDARQNLDWIYTELMRSVGTDHSQIIDAIKATNALLIERNDTLFPKASTLVGSGIPGFIIPDEEDSSDSEPEVRTTTTKSYKYGITCSESVITGVSLSEFFVP